MMSIRRRRSISALSVGVMLLTGCIAASHREVAAPPASGVRWEYAERWYCMYASLSGPTQRDIEAQAAPMGDEGWELVDIEPAGTYPAGGADRVCFVAMFKRPKL